MCVYHLECLETNSEMLKSDKRLLQTRKSKKHWTMPLQINPVKQTSLQITT